MSADKSFSLNLERIEGFEFKADFGLPQVEPLVLDEPEPVGGGKGPNPSRLLAASVGNCLSASLLFCLQKARLDVEAVRTGITGFVERRDRGRLRVSRLDVEITVDVSEPPQRVGRCLEVFEDYCVVTGSVKDCIEVNVLVKDTRGNVLLEQGKQPATD